jgi:cyclopropane fatty-acyl-phospholipid synthase-like methyltransferase
MTAATGSRPALDEPKLSSFYDDSFYEDQIADSLKSARIYLSFLWQFMQPAAVLDVGCGRGAWLKACHELGSTRLLGLDGDWNDQAQMIDSAVEFRGIDLNKRFSIPQMVDLAMSLEVAEHLEASTAPQFVECLTDASDVVLFSAAYPKQSGTNHINEQPQSFWAQLFIANGFLPVDLFRPAFWGNKDVCFWYRQNAFLYVRRGCEAAQRLNSHGVREVANVDFMDCVHPELFRYKAEQADAQPGFRNVLAAIGPSFAAAVRRRLSRIQRT